MWSKTVAKLKTGSVKNVVRYGDALPAPPYDVVKPEKAEGGRRFRVIAHRAKGQQDALEDHIREIIRLLDKYEAKSRSGARNCLRYEEYTDVGATSDDGTISMEASFTMPTRTL